MTTRVSRRTHAPLVLAVVLLLLVVTVSLRAALAACDGRLVYALDDAYIHLAMGRTLAESGTWGLAPGHVAFASSSPGWTLLLAGAYALGLTGTWVPLAFNLAAALALVGIVDAAARRVLATDRARAWLLVSIVFATPVPALVLSGMEALTQCALVAAFVALVARTQAPTAAGGDRRSAIGLGLLAGAACAVRYESAFVVVPAVALLAFRRRRALAAGAVCGAIAPMLAYAAFSVAHGGWLLPASVVLKAGPPEWHSAASLLSFVAEKGLPALHTQQPMPSLLVVLLATIVALGVRVPRLSGEAESWVLMACGAILVHVHLVDAEWLYRYKAYLMAIALPACAFGLSRTWSTYGLAARSIRRPVGRYLAILVLAGTLAGPLVVNAADALARGVRGCRAIYLQQYQVARFLARGGTTPVVVNDIGAVAYYARRPVVDLFGLATQSIAGKRVSRTLTSGDIESAARTAGASVAVLYARWFEGPIALPASWRCVATWTSAEKATVADDTVTWCATSEAAAAALSAELESFAPSLPPGVTMGTGSREAR
jgi:hypothetical protein